MPGMDATDTEQIEIDSPIGPIAIDIDGKPKDEKHVTLLIHMKRMPKALRLLLSDRKDEGYDVQMPRDIVRRYGQKLLDLADAPAPEQKT